MTETAREVDDAAALWAIRLDAAGSDGKAAAEAARWLAGDPRRAGALLRAQAAMHLVDHGLALAAADGRTRWEPSPDLRRRRLIWAVATGGLAAAGVGAVGFLQPGGRQFRTGVGEVRRVALGDGSVAAINTASRIAVILEPGLRKVSLDQGEAWFRVAKDPTRPFEVDAGNVRVRAVGTAFSVRRRGGGADVLVTEGVVEVWKVGDEPRRVRIAAGGEASVGDNPKAAVIQPVQAGADIDRRLAWRDGMIALHGETLAEAASEFNRYNTRKIVIASPDLAGERVVGQFRTDSPESFGQAVAVALDADCAITPDSIRLSRSNAR